MFALSMRFIVLSMFNVFYKASVQCSKKLHYEIYFCALGNLEKKTFSFVIDASLL